MNINSHIINNKQNVVINLGIGDVLAAQMYFITYISDNTQLLYCFYCCTFILH